ncbi:MAG TPA: hypothetical protein VMS43_11415 [Allosphingosinicella sp.]|nr:hypothetical protein [Allosphingosinicella sp.]
MADQGEAVRQLKAGEFLLWRIRARPAPEAEACARDMGRRADLHRLGEWGMGPIGLGASWWFDLTLATDVDEIFVIALFGRMPDEHY